MYTFDVAILLTAIMQHSPLQTVTLEYGSAVPSALTNLQLTPVSDPATFSHPQARPAVAATFIH